MSGAGQASLLRVGAATGAEGGGGMLAAICDNRLADAAGCGLELAAGAVVTGAFVAGAVV